MSSDLENDLAAALRFRAGEVPDTPCPPLAAAVPAPRRGRFMPVTVAAAVVGLVAAAVVLLPGDGDQDVAVGAATEVYYSRVVIHVADGYLTEIELWQGKERTDAWRAEAVGGSAVEHGRVVPDPAKQVDEYKSGFCYPAAQRGDGQCGLPGSWVNPTPEFLASAPRDPAVIKRQLRDDAYAEEKQRITTGGDFAANEATLSDKNLDYLQLNLLRQVLTANGVPDDLAAALHRTVTDQFPGIRRQPNVANLLGEKGTGYSLPDYQGRPLTVIFDARGRYLGAPDQAVVHGIAPALGEPPTRMLD